MRLYSVYDKVAEEFGPVFEQPNDATAKRAFKAQIVNIPYLADMELYCIGEFNKENGKILSLDNYPKIVDEGINYADEYEKLHPVRYIDVKKEKVNE